MTGMPCRRARRVMSFWALGTCSSGISSPRSPRATITASHAPRISSRCSSASGRSSLAMRRHVGAARSAISRRACRRSAAVWTKLSATMSTPSARPNRRSSMSFGVMADAGSGTPGALMPLCSPSSPPSTTVRRFSVPLGRLDPQLDQAVGEQQPVARRHALRQPFERRRDAPGPPTKSPVAIASVVAGRRAESAGRLRAARCGSSGPPRSCRTRDLAARAAGRRAHPARTSLGATRGCRARN